ncbi:HAD family hydrolase [Saccharothrix australiensis]|uniref:HAD family hydrolase n=1 Tax=Saccharothrix australiensis TaxID=2072 RepID=UPI000EB1C6D4
MLGRAIGIVSNNSRSAIEAYVRLHELGEYVDFIAARDTADPSKLKPAPHLLDKAIKGVGVSLSRCTFVGDSTTDIQAAKRSSVKSVAFANKAAKLATLASKMPDAMVTSMDRFLPASRHLQ